MKKYYVVETDVYNQAPMLLAEFPTKKAAVEEAKFRQRVQHNAIYRNHGYKHFWVTNAYDEAWGFGTIPAENRIYEAQTRAALTEKDWARLNAEAEKCFQD